MSEGYQNIFIDNGISLSQKQIEQFQKYYELLIEWNDKINLTAITEEKDVYYKHFIDSLSLKDVINDKTVSLLDVGSGAGFPSIPFKILYPESTVTIIDALQKRIHFLELLCNALDIDVELVHGRAEEFNRKNKYDIVTARAVANLQLLSELCIPFVKVNGSFISFKGPKYKEELNSCKNAFTLLGASLDKIHQYNILGEQKTLLIIKKIKETSDKYPRKFKKIKSDPL